MFLFLLLINKTLSEEPENVAEKKEGDVSEEEEEELVEGSSDEEVSIYEQLVEKKYLEKSKMNLKEEDEGKLEVFSQLAEENHSWFFENKGKLINIVIITLVIVLIILISFKIYRINEKIIEQNKKVKEYARQVENIIEDKDSTKFISWKDQKEGILFISNPLYKKNNEEKGSEKTIREEIKVINEHLINKEKEIDVLNEKVQQYLEDIAMLKKEYDLNKKQVIDEGNGKGDDKNVLRQFK